MATQITVDVSDIKDIVNGLKNLYNNIDKEAESMLREITNSGKDYLDKQYNNTLGSDPNITDIDTRIDKTGKGYSLVSFGKDVIYEEFGTGDEGETHPHPVKSNYNLRDYNSGSFIIDVADVHNQEFLDILAQNGITSGKFWSYTKNGAHLTQGVPSGQEMWKTRNYLIGEKIPEIVKEKGADISGYIIGSIKK